MTTKDTPPSATAILSSCLQLLLRGLRHRGQLAALETAEAGGHLFKTMIIAGGALCLLLLTGFTLTFAIAAAVWHLEARGWILGGVACAFLALALLLGFFISRRLRTWSPLATTRQQAGEDCDLLAELLPKDNAS